MNNNLFINYTRGYGNMKTYIQIHNYAKIPTFDKNELTMSVAMTNLN